MGKSNFDSIYTEPDPRSYYEALGELDYEIPVHSASLFGQIAGLLGKGRPARVADLCCSYGVNSTLLKYDVAFDEVVSHYTDPASSGLSRDELLAHDRAWLADRAAADAPVVLGLDASAPAVEYAVEAGLLDDGLCEDLETAPPSERLARELPSVDLITVSGGIGYITERTIDQILERAERPWLAALCLRWVDFGPIVDVAARHGLVTERLDDTTFRQRRFSDGAERDHVLSELASFGIRADGRESEGWHHTDLYLVRPGDEADEAPLSEIIVPEGGVRTPGAGSGLEVTVASRRDDLRPPGFSGPGAPPGSSRPAGEA